MTQGAIPGAVVVIRHQIDVIHIRMCGFPVDFAEFFHTATDSCSQLITAAGLLRQGIECRAQIAHQQHKTFTILCAAELFIGTAAAREFPVDINAIKEIVGFDKTDDGSNKSGAGLRIIADSVEWIR